jgi:uncharacterized protein
MDPIAIAAVALYAGLNAVILLVLTRHVVRLRLRLKIAIGDGGNPAMARAMRGQANFTELAPMALLLLLLAALLGAPGWVIHLFGVVLTVARAIHAAHFLREDAPMSLRVVGTLMTVGTIGTLAAGLILHPLARLF